MKYVAYGSNLNLAQMMYRCPGAVPVSNGYIEGYRLVYRGSKTGSYATIIPDKNSKVPVVVWDINSDHEISLDRYEGYPTFYYKKILPVVTDKNEVIEAMVYIMFDKALVGRPSDYYYRVCLQGYEDNGLDVNYLEESIEYNNKEIEKLEYYKQIALYGYYYKR